MTEFENKVLNIVKKVPRGRVTTYNEIARILGKPKAARAVGNALNKNPYAPTSASSFAKATADKKATAGKPQVPCHRVVKVNGEIGGYAKGVDAKIKLLKQEGIETKKGKVVNFDRVFVSLSKVL